MVGLDPLVAQQTKRIFSLFVNTQPLFSLVRELLASKSTDLLQNMVSVSALLPIRAIWTFHLRSSRRALDS
jgi:hypothetical protein